MPHVPSLWDDFILRNRRILVDQMEFLLAHVPKSSRLVAGYWTDDKPPQSWRQICHRVLGRIAHDLFTISHVFGLPCAMGWRTFTRAVCHT
jgi:hypothetical protein